MAGIIKWLTERRKVNITLLTIYFIAVVLPHKRFGSFLNNQVFVGITRDQYNLYVLIISLAALLIYGGFFYINAKKRLHKKKLWNYLVLNTLLAALIIKLLFVINIEIVHFPQYALFAILLFPITGNYNSTMIWSTIAGALDEAYQYFYLSPLDTSYYDFNDVITNLVGVVFGLLLLSSFDVENRKKFDIKKSSIWIGIGLIFFSVVVLHLSGLLSIYPNEARPFHILREWPSGFWTTVHPNVTFHVIRPIEGLVLVCILWLSYSKIAPDKFKTNETF